jgi:hypothetical protein
MTMSYIDVMLMFMLIIVSSASFGNPETKVELKGSNHQPSSDTVDVSERYSHSSRLPCHILLQALTLNSSVPQNSAFTF